MATSEKNREVFKRTYEDGAIISLDKTKKTSAHSPTPTGEETERVPSPRREESFAGGVMC